MLESIKDRLYKFLEIQSRYDLIKVLLVGLCFFVTLGSYTLIKEIKDSVFVLVVGKKYLPDIKTLSSILMIPIVLFYSWLAGRLNRKWLLIVYACFYGVGGILASFLIKHPGIGLLNEVASPHRIFGWAFYLFLEGFSPFVVSVLWAFLNSISRPEEVKNRYVFMTVVSKFGGALSAWLAWMFMSRTVTFGLDISDVELHFWVLLFASCLVLCVPLFLLYLFAKVPQSVLEGYSDQGLSKEESDDKERLKKEGSGIKLFFKYPYVLGIFGMIFFWETINVIFNYMRLSVGLSESVSMGGFSAFLYKNAMLTHLIGLGIALFGTASIIRLLGNRLSLMLIPVLTGGAIFFAVMFPSTQSVIVTYIIIRAINYSFSYPLREGLYIPTSLSIKFKAKSWIDSFGSKIAKTVGSGYNKILQFIPEVFAQSVHMSFFFVVTALWTGLAYFMGKRWQKAIDRKEVIGRPSSD